ncbi:MAG: DUF2079 domain-containing protein [Candidatus Eremiobacteraeota bacterium]|nr:DUF2079 domain-containing protein [Candidatus Eremiobacteraeota bacterium]
MRDRLLWVGCLIYAALFAALGAAKYAVHRNLVDFGIFSQTAASAFGCFCNPIEGSHWAFHFSPILYPVGVALSLARSPLTLIVLASIAGALVAPPIYGLVLRERGDVRSARLAALVAWLYPPLAGLVFGDFHENSFAPAAVAWTLYAFDAGLTAWTLCFAVVTLAIKEDQAVFLALGGAFGAWHFRGTPRGRVAAAVAAISVAVLIAFFGFIQPHAAASAALQWTPQRFYEWSSSDAAGLLPSLAARLGFLLLIFLPLLFLPLRTRVFWIAVAPLGEVLLSRMPTTFTIGTHYAGAWIGYVLAAFAVALRRLEPGRIRLASIACVVLCLLEFGVADPLHPGMNLRAVQARDVALDDFLTTLPNEVSVATQEEAYTHLAVTDPYAGLLPELPEIETQACFVLIDRDFPDSARLREYSEAFRRLFREARYAQVAATGGIELYRRTGPCR